MTARLGAGRGEGGGERGRRGGGGGGGGGGEGRRGEDRKDVKEGSTNLPLFYDIFAGEDKLNATSDFRALKNTPFRPENASLPPDNASFRPENASFRPESASFQVDTSSFRAEERFFRLFNEATLIAFYDYVKSSDWKYGRDKKSLDSGGFRDKNGKQFHNDCWSFVVDDSVA